MPETKKQNVTILYANHKVVKKFIKTLRWNEEFTWIYLGKDVLLSISLDELIGKRAQRLSIADSLQTVARDTRQDYIDYIGRLGSLEHTKYWWLTSVSEKNPFISNVFLYSCYINVMAKIFENTRQDLVIICESPGLMAAIADYFKDQQNIQVHYEIAASPGKFRLKNRIRGIKNTVYFLVRWTIRCILARLFARIRENPENGHPREERAVFIHSWADHRSFWEPGRYEDVFLGRLGNDLRRIHPRVYYLIDVLPTCFFPVALSKLWKIREKMVLMEEFLNPLDIILAWYRVSTHFPELRDIPRFMNLNITPVILEELEKDRTNSRAFQTYLCYIIGKKITRKYDVRSFIYSFENLMWEKMFCLAFREVSPGTSIAGYVHSTISKMEMFYSLSGYEKEIIPLPDLVVVPGIRAQGALTSSGFGQKQVVIGGAYRYHTLIVTSPNPEKFQGVRKILIVPTDDFNSTLELVTKSVHAFGEREGVECMIKLHPTLPRRKISKYLSGLPGNFVDRTETIDQILPSVDLVVYTGSTVSIEALAQGIPILHVRSDLTIDRDIFDEKDHIISVSQPEEMYQAFLKIADDGFGFQKMGQEIVREFFAPVDDSTLRLVLDKNH